jgi:hypothetical protein
MAEKVGTAIPEGGQIAVQLVSDQRLIMVKLSGAPKPEAIIGMLDELDALVGKDPSLQVLIDETDLGPTFIGPGDIARFVAAWRRGTALRSTRIAVFASNLAMYGLNRMFQGLANSKDRVGVFRDRASAETWLTEGRAP